MQTITLESLLAGDTEFEDTAILEPGDAAMEFAEVFQECAAIEQNLTAYEAAKIIKKSKSNSKKVKTATSKMKAKDAKAKKASGKVVKIKKVAKEDEEVDGGTGPLPSTSDTNGLTDTDLDAAPEQEVEVIEVADDQPATQEAADWEGMVEGKDYIVEYEDASILQLEAGAGDMVKKLGEGIGNLIEKLAQFVMSVAQKINDLFKIDEKFLDKNKAAIEAGQKNPGDGTVKVSKAAISRAGDFLTLAENRAKTVNDQIKTLASGEFGEGAAQQTANAGEGDINAIEAPAELQLSAIASEFKFDLAKKLVGAGSKNITAALKTAGKALKSAKSTAIKNAENKEVAAKIKGNAKAIQAETHAIYGILTKIRSNYMVLAHALAKAGGASSSDNGSTENNENK